MRSAAPDMAARLASVVLALGLAGCGIFGEKREPPEALPAPAGGASVERVWNTALGAASGVGFAPAVAGGSVWAAAESGTLMRIDAQSGRMLWRVDAGSRLTAGVGTDGSVAVVASRDGSLIAFDAEGQRLWTVPLGAEVVNPPAVADGLVLVRASDNRVIALDAGTGKRRWNFQRQNPPLVLRQAGGISIVDDFAFIGMPGGRIVALDVKAGAPRWDAPFALPRGTTDLERISDVVGAPRVIGRDVCAVAYQGRIGCLDGLTGRPVWSRDFSSASGFDVDERGLVAIDTSNRVRAFSRDGEPQWERTGFARRSLSAPLIAATAVAIGDLEGNLLVLTRSDGTVAARAATDGSPIVAAPARADGLAVVQTSAGGLFAFRIE
jgi:outer membrane protein assembly factor BamB